MTSSGTYNFNISNSNIIVEAFSRIGVRRSSLLAEHIQDGVTATNLAMVTLSNKIPNLWTSELQTVNLISGTATYTLPAYTVMIIACYIRTGSGVSQNDRLLFPASTYEYASYPNKNQSGFPSVFWFNRQITPQITFWSVPDDNGPYTAELQCVNQLQDANVASGETPNVPYRFLDALAADVAHRLSRIYAPTLEPVRKSDAMEAWAIAATNDTENVALNLVPGLSAYQN